MSILEIQGIENAVAGIEAEVQRIINEVIQPGIHRAGLDLFERMRFYIPQLTQNAYHALRLNITGPNRVHIFMEEYGPYEPSKTDYIISIDKPGKYIGGVPEIWLHGQTVKHNPHALYPGDIWVLQAMLDIGIMDAQREADGSYSGDITDDFKALYFGGIGNLVSPIVSDEMGGFDQQTRQLFESL